MKNRILETERLILRPWEETDAADLFKYAKDPDVGPIAGWPPHKSEENSRQVIIDVFNGAECYAICKKEDNVAIGAIELKLNGHTDMTERDDECELGYWLGKPFWGNGYMPEAAREILRHGFEDLKMRTIWCGYYDGNEKSKRVQEKVGFKYHHTCNDLPVPLMNEVRTGHTNFMTKKDWKKRNKYKIVKLSECPDLEKKAAKWFSKKWSVSKEAYIESIEESFVSVVPSWYLCLDGKKIIAGLGVIENDFHERKDLTPNVCAVYTKKKYRNQGIAGRMLKYVCDDMKSHGINRLYLITDHVGFYEKYDWKFYCWAFGDGEKKPSRIYVHYEETLYY